MPIEAEFNDDDRIAILKMIGNLTADEIEVVNRGDLGEFVEKHAAHRLDIIWDVREFEWDFQQFVKFLSKAKERRATQSIPKNLHQHYVGRNEWIQNLRTWFIKNYGEETTSFSNLEDALGYINGQKSKQ